MANRPTVPGKLRLHLRSRREPQGRGGLREVVSSEVEWEVSETAIIICDMWADHPCRMRAQWVATTAPRMNAVITTARDLGVMIIHAPSDGVHNYENTPYRQRMKEAPPADLPVPIRDWCRLDPQREPPLPIDYSDGGCDDPAYYRGPSWEWDQREHPAIRIVGYDGVSASGTEIYNFCRQEGIRNIALMGVHTNVCVLSRPFGIRQMCRLGMDVVLVRDLTDAMYDPRDRPYVSHARGTEMVIEHIETYWCPSIASDDLIAVVGGSAGPATTVPARGDEPAGSPRRQ